MTLEMIFVVGTALFAVILFATEKLPVDLVSILVMSLLLITGILSPTEGISGFSNTATVTVGAMFILTAGLFRTGAVNALSVFFNSVAKKSFRLSLWIMMAAIGVLSAFINNTAAVAVFIPIVLSMAKESRASVSRLLMPLSFASMFGGVCTLIGTSTNILVSSIAESHGLQPLGMFEFTPLGVIYFVAGAVYMFFAGTHMIPDRRKGGDLTSTYGMNDFLTEIVLRPEARSVGKTIRDAPLVRDLDITIVNLRRKGKFMGMPLPDTLLLAGDELLVRCELGKIRKLEDREGIALRPQLRLRDADLKADNMILAEVVVAPNSFLIGRSMKDIQFRNRFGAIVLAIKHRGAALLREKMSTARLTAGDALLVEVDREGFERLKRNRAFVIVSEVALPQYRRNKALLASAIIGGVVATAALGILPIVVSAIVGSLFMVLTGCISLEEAYAAIEWKIIFLLAGALTLGIALEKTGAAAFLAGFMVDTIGRLGPAAMLSAFYLLTSLLTEVMSNNAAAALLAPIVIAGASSLGVDPRPFLFAVSFAASASFMTPVGYQTNTMIYAAGQYRFADFLKVGAPLNIIFWIMATLLIPVFWHF